MNIPLGLINAVKQSQAVLFAGAGISYNALKVGGLELRNWIGAPAGYSLASCSPAELASASPADADSEPRAIV